MFEEAFRFNAGMTTHGECLFVHLLVTPISAHSVAIHIVFPLFLKFLIVDHDVGGLHSGKVEGL